MHGRARVPTYPPTHLCLFLIVGSRDERDGLQHPTEGLQRLAKLAYSATHTARNGHNHERERHGLASLPPLNPPCVVSLLASLSISSSPGGVNRCTGTSFFSFKVPLASRGKAIDGVCGSPGR